MRRLRRIVSLTVWCRVQAWGYRMWVVNPVRRCSMTAEWTGGGAGFARIRRGEADRRARCSRQQGTRGFCQRRCRVGQLLVMGSRVAECIDEAQLLPEDGIVA
jgi:hypothetical protein